MARRRNNSSKKLLIGGIIILAAVLLLRKQNTVPATQQNFNNLPPAPPRGTPQWAQWAALVVGTFGQVAQLWQPGGPFHGTNQNEVMQTVDDVNANNWSYGDWIV